MVLPIFVNHRSNCFCVVFNLEQLMDRLRQLFIGFLFLYPYFTATAADLSEWYPYVLQSAKNIDPNLKGSPNLNLNPNLNPNLDLDLDPANIDEILKERVKPKFVIKVKNQLSGEFNQLHLLVPHLHFNWNRFIKEQNEVIEAAHVKHIRVIDSAQDKDLKKNRYKIFLCGALVGGSIVLLPFGWGLAHVLPFLLPKTCTALVKASLIYFVQGEIIVQRYLDENKDCYGVLKKINEGFYNKKKEEMEQIDLDGHDQILEELTHSSFDLPEISILRLLQLTKYILRNNSHKPEESHYLLDQIVAGAIKNYNKEKARQSVNSIAANNFKRWQEKIFPVTGNDDKLASLSSSQNMHHSSLKRKKNFELLWEKYFWIEWLRGIGTEPQVALGDFVKSEIINHLRELWSDKDIKWEDLNEVKQVLLKDFDEKFMNELELAILDTN